MPEPPVELGTKWFVDIIFINGLPYFFASESLCNYLILTTLSFKSKAYLVEGFDKIISYVGSRRRTVRHFHSDAEINLTSCVGALGSKQVLLTQAPPEGHARKLERQVRTLRERMRAALHTLAYKLPLKLYQYLALYVVHNLNNLLNSLTARTPRELIDGIKPSLRHNARAAFGDLVMCKTTAKKRKRNVTESSASSVAMPKATASDMKSEMCLFLLHPPHGSGQALFYSH